MMATLKVSSLACPKTQLLDTCHRCMCDVIGLEMFFNRLAGKLRCGFPNLAMAAWHLRVPFVVCSMPPIKLRMFKERQHVATVLHHDEPLFAELLKKQRPGLFPSR